MTFPKIAIGVLLLILLPGSARAAELMFSGPSVVPVGTEFTLTVFASSTEQGFNAAEASISFNNDVLEVVSIDARAPATVFNFWLTSPKFSNDEGTIVFSGGTTKGQLGSDIPLLSVRMRATGVGDALITASDASINASDGRGTNILEDVVSLRVGVPEGTVRIPPAVVLPPPPVPEPEPVATTVAAVAASSDPCSGLFLKCDLAFPQIESVTTSKHPETGSDIYVSGVAMEGNHVHLVLTRNEIVYKEIVALIEPDRRWEAVFTNIFAYGTYAVSARVESEDNARESQRVTWANILIFPPLTFLFNGIVVRWYLLASIALGALTGLLLVNFLARRFAPREYRRPAVVSLATFMISLLLFSAQVVVAYVLWRQEFFPKLTYWGTTDIPCVFQQHSYEDIYSSIYLEILIDGEHEEIPPEIGVTPLCVAQVHTHDETGRLHFEALPRPATLGDFFTVAGVALHREGYELTLLVNGETYTGEPEGYVLHGEDVVVMRYVSTTEE